MIRRTFCVVCLVVIIALHCVLTAAQRGPGEDTQNLLEKASKQIQYFVKDSDRVSQLIKHLGHKAAFVENELSKIGESSGIREVVIQNVISNLLTKKSLDQSDYRLPMSATEIKRMVIEYEAYKLVKYVTSGVFPKRYFGYFDGKFDTAPYEKRLYKIIPLVVNEINKYQKEKDNPIRITDIEVAITFISEGGAILLRERQDLLSRLHPVMEVGLDDIASGFSDLAGLQERIDSAAGTDLCGLVGWVSADAKELPEYSSVPNNMRWLKHKNGNAGPHAYLKRYMRFEESIVGTALMYLWEKQIAAKKLAKLYNELPLYKRPLDEQFIITSLVYNSGLLHSPKRWEMTKKFTTGNWLFATSERNAIKRWKINVATPKAALKSMRKGNNYLDQPTEWLSVYHILQRYGGFMAIRLFTDYFKKDGSINPFPEE